MDKEEKKRYLENLKRELPARRAKLSQLKAEMRGLRGGEMDKKGREALTVQLEVNGMIDTIKRLERELKR